MSLPMAAAIALAASCQQAVAPETIVRIAVVESHLEPFAIHDNSDGRSYTPANRPDAVRLALALQALGHRLDIGLNQISDRNFPWLLLTLAMAFDPCSNIAASAEVLTAYSRYNTGTATKGISNGYAARVQAVQFNGPADPAPAPDPKPDRQSADPFTRPALTGRDMFFR